MEFSQKLQELRKQKGLTQEELAKSLYVSRTAISKWESGRGYPSIDSLKEIAKFFSVTVDQLLSGEEVLTIAQEDQKQKTSHLRDMVFGLLDISVVIFFFLPFFGQNIGASVEEVSLLALNEIQAYLKIGYLVFVIATALLGVLTLALQNWDAAFWVKNKSNLSLGLTGLSVLLFIFSRQPYAAAFLFIFFAVKGLLLLKKQ